MSNLFKKRLISGREIINPFRTKNSKEFLANNLEHEVKTIIDRLYWIEEENKKLEEENRRLKKGLDLLLKTAIHNKQGNSIVVTDDLMRLKKEVGDE